MSNQNVEDYELSGLQDFIDDITPFFHGRPITYVDVGAYEGVVYSALTKSSIKLRDIHLVEPNPHTYRLLSQKLDEVSDRSVHLHNVAIGTSGVTVRMIDRNDMSHVILSTPADRSTGKSSPDTFEVNSISLDDFMLGNDIEHISLLKIDVEGHEMPVLEGASSALAAEAVDVIYVEAGIDPKSNQQTYYRNIEDYLAKFNYRMFRIYEQTNEWIVDSPILRRVNIAFMSASFARNNPYKLSREISAVRRENDALKKSLAQLEVGRDKLQLELDKLSEKVAAAEDLVAVQAENQSLKDELSQLKGDHQAVDLKLAEVTRRNEDLVAVQAENQSLKDELSQLKGDHQAVDLKLAEVTRRNEDLVAVQAENQSLKGELAQLKSDYQAASLKLAETTRHNQDLSVSLRGVEANYSDARLLVDQLEKQLDERHREISVLILEIDKERAQNGDLISSLALLERRLQKQKDLYKKSIDNLSQVEAKIASDTASYEEQLRAQIRRRKRLQERVDTQQTQIENQRKAHSAMEKKAAESQAAFEAISSSTVWRATSPIRKVASGIKRLLK
ncbi:FkbM family methyltransferase [Neoaquamicrobium sediminum]|uniref:FkbM family methyltransferase n=1 Tax=Neoaquamicrobium sediminum TaxID=1849104 RepID=UPI003BAB89C2